MWWEKKWWGKRCACKPQGSDLWHSGQAQTRPVIRGSTPISSCFSQAQMHPMNTFLSWRQTRWNRKSLQLLTNICSFGSVPDPCACCFWQRLLDGFNSDVEKQISRNFPLLEYAAMYQDGSKFCHTSLAEEFEVSKSSRSSAAEPLASSNLCNADWSESWVHQKLNRFERNGSDRAEFSDCWECAMTDRPWLRAVSAMSKALIESHDCAVFVAMLYTKIVSVHCKAST